MKTEKTTVRLLELDRPSVQNHFVSLDGEDRRLRFGSNISDHGLVEYVSRLDFERDGLFAVHDEDLNIVALVHVATTQRSAELGLSVLPEWRGKGLGNALLTRAVTFLRNRGATEVFVHCLSENGAMMHLARKNGMRIVYAGSESDARLQLDEATAHSFIEEWLEDQRAHTVQAIRRNNRIAQSVYAWSQIPFKYSPSGK
jgi:ribosomal protein S18 acetylase RimI-like enzyme